MTMTNYNRRYCFNCSVLTEHCEEVGNVRLWLCDSPECAKVFGEEMRAIGDEMAQRAAEDDYRRYSQ